MTDILPGQTPCKKSKVQNSSQLSQLKQHTLVVADTGQFTQIQKYKPQDSTTNPSLILQVSQKPQFQDYIKKSIQFGINNYQVYFGNNKQKKDPQPIDWNQLNEQQKINLIDLIFDHVSVSFGCEILKVVPGYVSTQVDAALSFDKKQSINRAKRIIALYKKQGADTQRILIKLASTWQGIQAGIALRKDKIKCNMTLIFDITQAVACAKNNLFLISPFVGRILDWYKKSTGLTYDVPSTDPGVISVTQIYNYFRKYQLNTIVMGASFRNINQIKQLCGCDRLTISPKLLQQLSANSGQVPKKLDKQTAKNLDIKQIFVDQPSFRRAMNNNQMATDLLSDGIRKFEKDGDKLKNIIRTQIQAKYKKTQ